MRNKFLAIVGTALAVFGLVCPAAFVLGLEVLVAAAVVSQLGQAGLQWRLPQPPGVPSLSA
jgi:hypothetical protein